ncbi:type II toxin-antitoxin system PemK/MazF family toxin [Burkholderia gladioli]|uniref:type II toxin-antitoxin system PemK/MazF family toxin n=1 Tax=Burkholderia gladioli TaxID=28095 RepID=UPI000618721B|nr:type II toxin-antitoxin system PemK/MazF family toxin [Burkholderia gladioli]MBW5286522.1 type II toxin-antitoxin system PemK/MazF family toxin [Burkholderia gladioli]
MASRKPRRGEVWAVDFEPQTHRREPGKRNRPALVIQTDLLNDAGHPTTIVVPGTSKVMREDCFPLRVALGRLSGQAVDEATDLLIDQVRAIANERLMGDQPIGVLNTNQLRRVEDALRLLMKL